MDSALILLAAVVGGWIVQAYLTYQQSVAFQQQVRALRRRNPDSDVSIGVGGKRYRGGRAYVAVAVDEHRIVRDALTIQGFTTFARGKACPPLVGAKANQVLGNRDYPGLSKQQREAARQAVELLGRGGDRQLTEAA
jgi:DNA-binding transcriptional regulator of glucitol operon